jgi:hypothetical protein
MPTHYDENQNKNSAMRNIGRQPKGRTNSAKKSRLKRKLEALKEGEIKITEEKENNICKKYGTI